MNLCLLEAKNGLPVDFHEFGLSPKTVLLCHNLTVRFYANENIATR